MTPEQFARQNGLELATVQRWIVSGRLSERNGLTIRSESLKIDPLKFARAYPMRRAEKTY
jgi:hypothetical protein